MKKLMVKIVTVCLWIYCCIAYFDPSDLVLGAKLPLFALILLTFLMIRLKSDGALPRDLLVRVSLIALIIPAFYLGIFLVRHPGQSIIEGLSLAKGLLAIMLVLPVVALRIDLKKPVLLCISLMILFIIGLQACSSLNPWLFQKISFFLTGNYVALIGSRSFGELNLAMIFFITTPLLVIPVPFLVGAAFATKGGWWRRSGAFSFLLLILLASFFSASRAVFLVLLAEYLVCFLIAVRHRPGLLAGGVMLSVTFSLLALLALQRSSLLSAEEQSNMIKIAHFESFLDYIDENPVILLTGDGLGASYNSRAPGVSREVYQTELTYLDIIRYSGLAGFLVFLLLLIVPFCTTKFDFLNFTGFLAYLLVAGSNPLLFNSTGMLAVTYFWSQQYSSGRMKCHVNPSCTSVVSCGAAL